MILKKNFDPIKVLGYVQWELLWSLFFVVLARYLAWLGWLPPIPFVLMGVMGTAMAIFIGFRNNSSYARWWEARTVWGGILNHSRILSRQVGCNVEDAELRGKGGDKEVLQNFRKEFTYLLIAFAHTLRLQLRGQDMQEVKAFIPPAFADSFDAAAHKPQWILFELGRRVKQGVRLEILGAFDNISLEPNLSQLQQHLGSCERIKKTPMLRQYDYFTRIFLYVFYALFPFALLSILPVDQQGWVFPISILITFIYAVIHKSGVVNENPFENRIQDVPMSAICRELERNLKEDLGEAIPPSLEAEEGYLF